MLEGIKKILGINKKVVQYKDLDIKTHTVITMIAPSGSGKTYLVNRLIKQLNTDYPKLRVKYIGSDDIRREILCTGDYSDNEMQTASIEAFKILDAKLTSAMSYPINNEIIIIDSTGINNDFREAIRLKANKHNYHNAGILLDYKNDDYYKYVVGNDEKRGKVTSRQIRQLRKVLPKINNRKFDGGLFRIRSIDKSNVVRLNVTDYDKYSRCVLPKNEKNYIIGDVHGCYDELVSLLVKKDIYVDTETNKIFENRFDLKIVLLGDFIDKGKQVKKVIDFIYKNQDSVRTIIGNHENFVYKYMQGKIDKNDENIVKVMGYFDSIELFEKDIETYNKFCEIFERSTPFLNKRGSYIITHTPTRNEFLGKITKLHKERGGKKVYKDCESEHIKFYYPRREEGQEYDDYLTLLDNKLEFLKEDKCNSYPFHVFGHLGLGEKARITNKICIDTNCVEGNKLTGLEIDEYYNKVYFEQVNSVNKVDGLELPILFKPRIDYNVIDLDNIDIKSKKRMNWVIRNKVNFISGTISPVDKDLETNTLEDVITGLKYYQRYDIDKVILQPKYMGSRCNVYLFKDENEESYLVSRGGYKIKEKQLERTKYEGELKRLRDKLFSLDEYKDVRLIILDSELLPWSALGRGLIDKNFVSYGKLYQHENSVLEETQLDSISQNILNTDKYKEYIKDKNNVSKKDLVKKYKQHVVRLYDAISQLKPKDNTQQQTDINTFNKQIEIYGKDTDVEIKPFNILKVVYDNGEEITCKTMSNIDNFLTVSDDVYLIVDFKELTINDVKYDTFNDLYNKVKKWYDTITVKKEMEGVVIKPEMVYNKDIAPMLKCRNSRYLTIVYSPDYLEKSLYDKLFKEKNISRKLKVSTDEFKIGLDMLEVKYDEITEDNEDYRKKIAYFIKAEEEEKELDPRL